MDKFMIGVLEKPEYVDRNIDELELWDDNPRTVEDADVKRLVQQILTLGVYKPVLINQSNIVLGGNRRIDALRAIGVKIVSCSLVKTDNKAQMMDYALSDNDQIGVTDEQKVQEYIAANPSPNTHLFAINSSPMKLVSTMLNQFEPNENKKTTNAAYAIRIAFNDMETLEACLTEIQEVCERYEVRGISVNDGN